MTPSPERSPTKAKEASSAHEVRLVPLDTKPVFTFLSKYFGDTQNGTAPGSMPLAISVSYSTGSDKYP